MNLWTATRTMDAEAVAVAVDLVHGVKCTVDEFGAGWVVTCDVPAVTSFGAQDAHNAIRTVRDRLTAILEE